MFTKFEAQQIASCPRCGIVKPINKTCVQCATEYMNLTLKIQDALDERNLEWKMKALG